MAIGVGSDEKGVSFLRGNKMEETLVYKRQLILTDKLKEYL